MYIKELEIAIQNQPKGSFHYFGRPIPPAPFPEGKGEKEDIGEIFDPVGSKISPISSFSPPRSGEGQGVGQFHRKFDPHP
jgi:hypothetical protein